MKIKGIKPGKTIEIFQEIDIPSGTMNYNMHNHLLSWNM